MRICIFVYIFLYVYYKILIMMMMGGGWDVMEKAKVYHLIIML